MATKHSSVPLPADLLADIDSIVGADGRDAFLIDVLRQEVNRRRLLQLLNSSESFWKEEDHPDLAEGAEAWVRKMRSEDLRLEREKLGDRWLGQGELGE